jgi:hypothetical protein
VTVVDRNGQAFTLSEPRNGASNSTLIKIGASYGVLKLAGDPHWSVNGH